MHLVRKRRNKKFDFKILRCKKFLSDIPRDKHILPRTSFTQKYPKMNFPNLQYTVFLLEVNDTQLVM